MNTSKSKEPKNKLQDELEKTFELSKLLKKQVSSMELIKLVAIYIAVLITVIVIWFIWYT